MTDSATSPRRDATPKPESAAQDADTGHDTLDEALTETFPASDPIAPAQTTRIDPVQPKPGKNEPVKPA